MPKVSTLTYFYRKEQQMKPKLIACYTLLIAMLTIGCGEKRPTPFIQHQPKATLKAKPKVKQGKPRLIESFSDSLNIARKRFNKVMFERYAIADSNYVVIQFFSKQNDKWVIKNDFHFPKDNLASCFPEVANFNNDGLKDFTYVSNIAARGSNEVRTLFIYNNQNDALIRIKNSEDFPNMQYVEELNCVTAFAISGSYDTLFAKLEADSLRLVMIQDQTGSDFTISVHDKNGKEKVIKKTKADPNDIGGPVDFNIAKKYINR